MKHMVAREGLEPPTPAFSGLRKQSLTDTLLCGFMDLQPLDVDAIWTPDAIPIEVGLHSDSTFRGGWTPRTPVFARLVHNFYARMRG